MVVEGAPPPLVDINSARHGNLASAQNFMVGAYDKLSAAQQANRGALGGHAERAKQLLREASEELKWAAEAANQR